MQTWKGKLSHKTSVLCFEHTKTQHDGEQQTKTFFRNRFLTKLFPCAQNLHHYTRNAFRSLTKVSYYFFNSTVK